eukprot:Nitzschia sp. Nitz4//scaffold177_size45885//17105//21005//NITZ4_007204-RA/size45885-augustus-gene-0.5-mRNA-1//-1//CDS//3329539052//1807//frame0
MMRVPASILLLLPSCLAAQDLFNYDSTSGTDYGPEQWNKVSCNDLETCGLNLPFDTQPGWPQKLLGSVGWELQKNECEWCPLTGNSCGQHRQSPIDLQRDRAIANGTNWKDCPDWHWYVRPICLEMSSFNGSQYCRYRIQYLDGTCSWEDMSESFEITRNTLTIHTPITDDGDIDCGEVDGEKKFPKLDYSKGFPDWWYLSQTDISVTSEHTQLGKRYEAEVKLSHFYEIDMYKNKLGIVSFFMQGFESEEAWPYLDKLICKWREEEEKKRAACGFPPAPVYKLCELYRGQNRTDDDSSAVVPTVPDTTPDPLPLENLGADPDDSAFPLSMCQGDCDFDSDCAAGLKCLKRDANEEVPYCIGGESDSTETDYCVFDPYVTGFYSPTDAPTFSPTHTMKPTLAAIESVRLKNFGATPPEARYPLQYCEGDCDSDGDCADGLICYQRDTGEAVPGCLGGESDGTNTDYCIFDPHGDGYTISPTLTRGPTDYPSASPTESPSASPTVATPSPTSGPSASPTDGPTASPSEATPAPTSGPSVSPTDGPSASPTETTPTPTATGSDNPTGLPSAAPSGATPAPSVTASDNPTDLPSVSPSGATPVPSVTASDNPTDLPSPSPSEGTSEPTMSPSATPTAPTGTPTTSPTGIAPTEVPVVVPTMTPTSLPDLQNIGWEPPTPMQLCQGDCDVDSDCDEGLYCFQRNMPYEVVPGCAGGDKDSSLTDYCTVIVTPAPSMAPFEDRVGTSVPAPIEIPTDSPTESFTSAPTIPSVPLKKLGWTPLESLKPLGRCEGDCDVDDDCQGNLVCYQRYLPNQAVPGCSGGEAESSLMDFCIVPDLTVSTAVPTTSPTMTVTLDPTTEPTSSPTASPTISPTDLPTVGPTAFPTTSPTDEPTMAPTYYPTAFPTENSTFVIPPEITCADYSNVNFKRMCKDDSCCSDPRSSSAFCHESYAKLGDDLVESACYHCCIEERGEPMLAGPAPEEHPDVPNVYNCDDHNEINRMCKEDSCCDDPDSSSWCRDEVALLTTDQFESICWYCCYPSKEVDWDERRELLSLPSAKTKESSFRPIGENDRVTHNVQGKRVIVREENFEEKGLLDDDAYFRELLDGFRRRAQENATDTNYDSVAWWPYEWFLKAGTEYYFRYEGTQTVPPCYDTAHWRVFKDPIRVAAHQMRELERLIAWRLGDDCEVDTAGKSSGDVNFVDVARPLQSIHKLHRLVFCECQDWPSKFDADREWCSKYQTADVNERLFENPYNWPSDGFDFLED